MRTDERDRFVAGVLHDLRTPLTRLRLRAENLRDEERRRFGLDIDAMDGMIKETLDYLRGVVAPEPMTALDIRALLGSLVADQLACGHGVLLSGDAAPLLAQASALRRALDNLVENAIRYGGGAEIRVRDDGVQLRIDVCDCGPGIPEDELHKVLAPFDRVEATRLRNPRGVGLGLSIAHDIARQHGGTLRLRNAPEGGLVASLLLPRSGATSIED